MMLPSRLSMFIGLALLLCCSGAQAQQPVLHVYGPGGPLGPMREAGELFGRQEGVRVEVTGGPEAQWIARAEQDADLFFGGAEYMLSQFIQNHPGMVDESTRVSLWIRPSGILVRPGNPKKIRTLKDLTRPGIRIIDVNGAGQLGMWEDMAGARGLIPGIRKNIALTVKNSGEAIERWSAMPELDAWITYESWYFRLRKVTSLVRLPAVERVYRGTPIAVAARSRQPDLARRFILFLQSRDGHAIFRRWGWK